MEPRLRPRTLRAAGARPAYRPIVCLDHGLTHGADVTAVADPGATAPTDSWLLTLAVAAVAHGAQPSPLTVDLTDWIRQGSLSGTVAAALHRHQLDPAQLAIKVSADCAMADVPETIQAFEALRAIGCPVGISGVGSSLGSLRLLTRLPMDFAELDAGLVADMLDDPDALTEAHAVLGKVHDAGLDSVAAGVASHEQAQWLRELGCHHGHGLYFGEPSHWLVPPTAHHCARG